MRVEFRISIFISLKGGDERIEMRVSPILSLVIDQNEEELNPNQVCIRHTHTETINFIYRNNVS